MGHEKIRATAGWLILLVSLVATDLLFINRLGFLQRAGGEPSIGESVGSDSRALSGMPGFLLPLAIGHLVGLGVLWLRYSKTAVPGRLRHVSRLGAAGSIVLLGADFPPSSVCTLCLVAHGANLAFWLLLESNRERRSVWEHARRTTDPLHPYVTAFAAAAAVLVAVERGCELQRASSVDSRSQTESRRSHPSEATSDAAKPQPLPTADPNPLEAVFREQTRQASLAATVRVMNRSETITGSGTIVFAGSDFACILTAAHLVRFGDEISIEVFEGDQRRIRRAIHDVQVWGLDPKNDLAMLWVSGDARLRAAVPIGSKTPVPSSGTEIAVLALTCGDSDPPTSYFETARQRTVRKRATAEPVEIWEGNRIGFRGQSGGGLVDQQGFLIGVRSGIAGGKAYYVHHSPIHRFLQKGEFYRASADPGGPPAYADLWRSLAEMLGPAAENGVGIVSSQGAE